MKYTTTISKEINKKNNNYEKIIRMFFEDDDLEYKDMILNEICKIGTESNIILEEKESTYKKESIYKGFANFKEKYRTYIEQKIKENAKLDISQIKLIPYEYIVLPINFKSDVMYFDEYGILRSIPLQESYGIVNGINEHGKPDYKCRNSIKEQMFGSNNLHYIRQVLKKMKPGDNYEKFLDECSKFSYETMNKLHMSELERFIARIDRISIERETDNFNKNTFDFIRVQVYLNELDDIKESVKEKVQKNLFDITNMVLDKINNNNYFKKYNVPIEFLKVSKITLTKDLRLEFLFELKEFAIEENKNNVNFEKNKSIGAKRR